MPPEPDTDLKDANLAHAFLTRAHLHSADLTGTDLTDADLRNAKLRGAKLTDAVGLRLPPGAIWNRETHLNRSWNVLVEQGSWAGDLPGVRA
ncbi:pentapeptide repeat-containing protein [Streptomyces sp. NPDC051453]|uniref:pentapeptide repeat-containing protein n=1 Tax=Streptomyces sp. NPDC051453 TaxID=3154941 RepID=UPI003416BC3F